MPKPNQLVILWQGQVQDHLHLCQGSSDEEKKEEEKKELEEDEMNGFVVCSFVPPHDQYFEAN